MKKYVHLHKETMWKYRKINECMKAAISDNLVESLLSNMHLVQRKSTYKKTVYKNAMS